MMSEFQLLYTRISHDLAGVSGAVYNGAELLSESPEYLEDATPVLMDSAKDLIVRLRFFRQTFGVPAEKTEDVTALYLKSRSNPVDLEGTCETQIQKMLAMTLADLMIWGGSIVATENRLVGQFSRISESVSLLKEIFEGKTDCIAEQNIVAKIAYLSAERENKYIRITEKSDEIVLAILTKD